MSEQNSNPAEAAATAAATTSPDSDIAKDIDTVADSSATETEVTDFESAEGIGADGDESEAEGEAEGAAAEAEGEVKSEVTPKEPAEKPAAEKKDETKPEEKTAEAPAAEKTPEKKEEPTPETGKTETTEKPAEEKKPPDEVQMREQLLTSLEQTYAIPEEVAARVMAEPEKVLPKLLSSVHVNVLESVLAGVASALPGLIHSVQTRTSEAQKYRDGFYSEFPALNKPEYSATVNRLALVMRTQNPTMSAEDAVREIGVAASVALRVPLPEKYMPGKVEERVEKVTQPMGARRGGAATTPAKPRTETNEFTDLANEDFS